MKPGASLSLRPRAKTPESDLERLKALERWTEEPAASQVALVAPSEDQKTEPVEPVQTGAAEVGQGAGQGDPTGVVAEPAQPTYPWQDENIAGVRQVNARLPAKLALQLKWLGETTYGESINSIILGALRAEVDRRLKERGVNV